MYPHSAFAPRLSLSLSLPPSLSLLPSSRLSVRPKTPFLFSCRHSPRLLVRPSVRFGMAKGHKSEVYSETPVTTCVLGTNRAGEVRVDRSRRVYPIFLEGFL